jgi:hypothetical protein
MTIISVFFSSTSSHGGRSIASRDGPRWRRRQWCASCFGPGDGRDGKRRRRMPSMSIGTRQENKTNHPRSKRRVVCLSIKPAELFRPAFLSRLLLGKVRSGHHPIFFPSLTLFSERRPQSGLTCRTVGTVRMWGRLTDDPFSPTTITITTTCGLKCFNGKGGDSPALQQFAARLQPRRVSEVQLALHCMCLSLLSTTGTV